jgi:hypothetical protein
MAGYLYSELATIWWPCELFRYDEDSSRVIVTRMATSTRDVIQGIFKRHTFESFGALNELCTSQPLGPIEVGHTDVRYGVYGVCSLFSA